VHVLKISLAIIIGTIIGLAWIVSAQAQVEDTKAPMQQAPAQAATAASAPAVPAEDQEAYGEVVTVDAAAGKITITEYDYDKDEDVNRAYTVDKAATYENVKALGEVKVGDWVALTLKKQADGTSSATSVYVERYDLGEETAAPAQATTAAPVQPAQVPAPAAAPAADATK